MSFKISSQVNFKLSWRVLCLLKNSKTQMKQSKRSSSLMNLSTMSLPTLVAKNWILFPCLNLSQESMQSITLMTQSTSTPPKMSKSSLPAPQKWSLQTTESWQLLSLPTRPLTSLYTLKRWVNNSAWPLNFTKWKESHSQNLKKTTGHKPSSSSAVFLSWFLSLVAMSSKRKLRSPLNMMML